MVIEVTLLSLAWSVNAVETLNIDGSKGRHFVGWNTPGKPLVHFCRPMCSLLQPKRFNFSFGQRIEAGGGSGADAGGSCASLFKIAPNIRPTPALRCCLIRSGCHWGAGANYRFRLLAVGQFSRKQRFNVQAQGRAACGASPGAMGWALEASVHQSKVTETEHLLPVAVITAFPFCIPLTCGITAALAFPCWSVASFPSMASYPDSERKEIVSFGWNPL